MSSSKLLSQLIQALQVMPGIGPRSAARIAYTLLDRKRPEALKLAQALQQAMTGIELCPLCRDYSDGGLCSYCKDELRRSSGQLCVVESPADVQALEASGSFRGTYFVLHGHLSPLDGIGPAELGMDKLEERLSDGSVREVILAVNSTVEGDITASFIASIARRYGLQVSRLASGVPVGGDLNTLDEFTLAASLQHRTPFD